MQQIDSFCTVAWQFLESVKDELVEEGFLPSLDGITFQKVVTECFKNNARNSGNWEVNDEGEHAFPDLILTHLVTNLSCGVEIKLISNKKQWKTLGNSVFEGTRTKKTLEEIFVLCGNYTDQKMKIKVKTYSEVVSDVLVTHSPRYQIDMNCTSPLFSQIGISYKEFRESSRDEKLKKIKNHYVELSSTTERPWWFGEGRPMDATLHDWRDLPIVKKREYIVEVICESPKVFKRDYSDAIYILLVNYSSMCKAVRDIFSASGKTSDGLPHIVGVLRKYRPEIERKLKTEGRLLSWICEVKKTKNIAVINEVEKWIL